MTVVVARPAWETTWGSRDAWGREPRVPLRCRLPVWGVVLACDQACTTGSRGQRATCSEGICLDPARFFAASRLVIVAGKGGVGKTTVTAALARAAARVGLSTLVIEVEGKSGLAALFGQAAARLRRGRRCRRAAARRARARCGPARSPPTRRCSSTSATTACRRISKRLVSLRRARRGGHRGARASRTSSSSARSSSSSGPGAADLIVLDAPAAGHAITFLQSARGAARRRAGRADQRPGARRARDAHRPRALPGGARDAARGDAGQRAGRHRLQPRGPGRRRPRPGRGQRPLPPTSPGSTPIPVAAADAAGTSLRAGEADGARRRRPRSGATGRRCRPSRSTRLAEQLPLPQLRLPFVFTAEIGPRRGRRCSPTALLAEIDALAGAPCDGAAGARPTLRELVDASAASSCAAARAAWARPPPRRCSRSRRPGPGRRAVRGHHRPGQAAGRRARARRASPTRPAGSTATGPASCGR